jgi:dihydrolipoamide dehydrogenase
VWSGGNIIIATGSETKWLPIKGIDDPRVVDSTGLLNLDTLPKRLAIIGAGVIGMEFASVFNRFGSEVTVIEYLKECLPALDGDIAKRLRKSLEKRGITFKMKTAVENIADIDADVILMATGRKPRTEGLNLEALGITLAPNGAIPVDPSSFLVLGQAKRQSRAPHASNIFAIGDCNGLQMLAHAAEMQAVRAVNHIIGKRDAIDFSIMPAAIFTAPEAACVGPTEDQLKAQAVAYECRKSFWRANGKALAMNETDGMLKLFVSPDGLILGCHAYGAHSSDIVQEVSVLMCKHTTISELADMVHIHPTLSEILKSVVDY